MKKSVAILILAAAIIMHTQCLAYAVFPSLVPPYHWTYLSLSSLSAKGLVNEEIIPGKSAFTPVQVAKMTAVALARAKNAPEKLNENEFLSLKQLVSAYRDDFYNAGYDYKTMQKSIDLLALRTGFYFEDVSNNLAKHKYSKAVNAINKTAFEIFKRVSETKESNIFLSPYSISTALAMLYTGARTETEAEMEKVLGFTPDIEASIGELEQTLKKIPQKFAEISTANAVWPSMKKEILPDYIQLMSDNFNANIKRLNYAKSPEASRAVINQWTAKQTHNKINNLIPKGVLSPKTSLVLTNAIYFNAKWDKKFDIDNTYTDVFNTLSGKNVKALMMRMNDEELNYVQMNKFEFAELPYQNSRFSMFIMLPSKESNINELQGLLNYDNLQKWIGKLHTVNADIYIPKFKQESTYEMSDILSDMGMTSAFSGSADFSAITGNKDLFVTNIIHKTFIDVAEEGTEAAAATAVILMKMSAPAHHKDREKVIFKADRPFIYIIMDNLTGTIMFIGRYAEP